MNYFFFAAERLPHPTGSGVAVLNDGLLASLQQVGWTPIVVPIALSYGDAATEQAHRRSLQQRGIEVLDLPGLGPASARVTSLRRLRRFIHRWDHELIPWSPAAASALRRLAVERQVRAVVAAGWHALGQARSIPGVYRIASLVDLLAPYIALRRQALQREGWGRRVLGLRSLANLRRTERLGLRYLRDFELTLEHASQHADELRALGYANVSYLPHPLRDPGVMPRSSSPGADTGHATVVVPGSLKGAASQRGLLFLLDELLPALEARQAELKRPLRLRVVGHGDPPAWLRARLVAHPWVDLVGYVEDIGAEYLRADAILVTIPVEHGFRTRIAEACGYGACVVAHAANAAGMPELRDGDNALLHRDAAELAARLLRAVNDPGFARTVGDRAYATFRRAYVRESAAARLRTVLPAELLPPGDAP